MCWGETDKLFPEVQGPCEVGAGLTVGAASSSIRPQVEALFSSRSEITPARIPPAREREGPEGRVRPGQDPVERKQDPCCSSGKKGTTSSPDPFPQPVSRKLPQRCRPATRGHLGLGVGFQAGLKAPLPVRVLTPPVCRPREGCPGPQGAPAHGPGGGGTCPQRPGSGASQLEVHSKSVRAMGVHAAPRWRRF